MFKKVLFSTVFSLFTVSSLFAAAKFPFPQDQPYLNGIRPANTDHNVVQAAYQVFMTNFYEESGSQARIKWDTASLTVSEGIGYGMLILVWMDNAKNNTQAKFDKLWAYYNAHLDPKGIMDWKINGFGGTAASGGATDGDIDVALALCLAYYQWGDAKYKTDATALLGKIWQYEVSGGNMLYPGDQFKEPFNPSYFITAGLDMFNKIKFDNNNWAGVATGCYSLLKSCSNKNSSGLVPDWCNNDGSPNGRGGDYTFDAARTPWRMAMAFCWYGDGDAKTIDAKINTWIINKTGGDPTQIQSGYYLNGAAIGTYNIPTYIGPFACAAMVDQANQTWLNACYNRLSTFIDNDNYYNQSIKVLSLLLLTGNALDFSSATPKTAFKITTAVSPASAGSVTVSPQNATYTAGTQVTFTANPTGTNKFVSWGGDLTGATSPQTVAISSDMNVTAYFNAGAADLIDDCEDGNNLNTMGGKWFSYNDVTSKGKSTVTPLANETQLFPMSDGGANGSAKCAKITFKLDSGNVDYNPFVGIGFWLKATKAGDSTVDISAATGLTFYFKGEQCDVRVETTNITDFGYYFKRLPKSADWTLISLKWTDMAQATWAVSKPFDRTKSTKICWQTPNIGKTGDAGDIVIDDIHLPGYVVPVGTMQPAIIKQQKSGIVVSQARAGELAIRYSLQSAGGAKIALYDLGGKVVLQRLSKKQSAGTYAEKIDLSGNGITNGTYFVQVKTDKESFSGVCTVMK
jgi:endo-1,4-beta-D-glucanase Y